MTRKRALVCVLLLVPASVVGLVGYAASRPHVLNESNWQHAHCILQAGLALHTYADKNGGKFPTHKGGYGDALLLLLNGDTPASVLTGPGYGTEPYEEAKRTGSHLPEASCGRIYVQGLTTKSNGNIAILFDRVATPGDHCPLPMRLWRPFGREVWMVHGGSQFINEDGWDEFRQEQIELLVAEGIARREAERLYNMVE
jgi:hypothetical protein